MQPIEMPPSIHALGRPEGSWAGNWPTTNTRGFGKLQSVGLFACATMAYSGSLKEVPPFNLSNADLTLVATLTAVGIGLLYSILIGSFRVGRAVLTFILFVAIVAAGSIIAVPTEYGNQKFTRLFIVTLPAVLAVLLILRDNDDAYRFMRMLFVFGIYQSAFINFNGVRQFGFGRLTTEEGTTISFGRAAGFVVIVSAAWLISSQRLTPGKVLLVAAVGGFHLWTLLAIASKGPILGLGLGVLAVSLLQLRRLRIQLGLRLLGLLAVLTIAFAMVWVRIPKQSRDRLVAFGDGDGSTDVRKEAWDYTWQHLDGALIGNGWGSWDVGSPIPIVYPHNIFLEVWFEAGVIALLALLAMLVLAFQNQDTIFRSEHFRGTMVVGSLTYWLATALVSGELNDNKTFLVVLLAATFPLADHHTDHDEPVPIELDRAPV